MSKEMNLGQLLLAAARVGFLGGEREHAAQVCEENGWDPKQMLGAVAATTSGYQPPPRDLEKLKAELKQGPWHFLARGTAPQFRVGPQGNINSKSPFGYCYSSLGACGKSMESYDEPFAYRKKDDGGGKVCAACFTAGGGVEEPYKPKTPAPAPAQEQLGYDPDEF